MATVPSEVAAGLDDKLLTAAEAALAARVPHTGFNGVSGWLIILLKRKIGITA